LGDFRYVFLNVKQMLPQCPELEIRPAIFTFIINPSDAFRNASAANK